ncbi:hypothetical protein AB0L43_23770, partial [Micromonospora globbae]
VGAGTVLTAGDVADVAAAGAQFVVTPAVVESTQRHPGRHLLVPTSRSLRARGGGGGGAAVSAAGRRA